MNAILIHISGLPCSGKSHIRKHLEALFSFEVVDIEDVWREVFKNPNYSKDESEIVFAAFLRKIADALRDGRSIIAESVLASEARFHELVHLADLFKARRFFILVEAQHDVIKERLKSRRVSHQNVITDDLFEDIRRRFATKQLVNIVIDSTHGIEKQVLQTLEKLIYGTTIHTK